MSGEKKFFMATSTTMPKVGKKLQIQCIQKFSDNQITIKNITIPAVIAVRNIIGNVYLVCSTNAFYITKILCKPDNHVHFAIIRQIPIEGLFIRYVHLNFKNGKILPVQNISAPIDKVHKLHGLYIIQCKETTYVCMHV